MAPCHRLKSCATADLTFDRNSLVPRRWDAIIEMQFLVALLIEILKSFDNALWWMPWNLTDDKSMLVQVMAWCHQATSHYLSQCWPGSQLPHGVTRPQWVNSTVVLKKHTWESPTQFNELHMCFSGLGERGKQETHRQAVVQITEGIYERRVSEKKKFPYQCHKMWFLSILMSFISNSSNAKE